MIVLRGAAFRRSELKLKVYFSPKLNYRGLAGYATDELNSHY